MSMLQYLCLFIGIVAVPTHLTAAERAAFHVVGYLPDYRLAAFSADAAQYVTDLIYFSAEPTLDGEIKSLRLRGEDLKKLQTIKRKHRLSLSLCIGGWGRSAGFAELAASEKSRQRFAANLVGFCRENEFDGVDLDWEHPANEAQRQDYGKLITDLNKGFEPHGLLVTAAIAEWQSLPDDAIRALDRVHLMAYDARGRHSTYDYAVSSVERLVKGGVPVEKICLGVPFYGRGIDDPKKSMTYEEIVRKYNPPPATDVVDRIYFNGSDTIGRKTRYALENKLGGIMIWELGQDAPDERSLLRAIHWAANDER
jgi:chitinase